VLPPLYNRKPMPHNPSSPYVQKSMANRVILELCVDSIESAIAADRGGADRIELCSSLLEGGLTPSPGVISTVLSKVSLGVFVMIRPRGGDFCYSTDEFKAMEKDVLTAKQLGADGVVFGILKEDGRVDTDRTRRLVGIARPLKVTFHRAFDMSRDLSESLAGVIRAGVDRVLTSGGEQNVELGQAKIAQLNRQAKDRVIVMPGSGIDEQNVRQLLSETGVREIHASLRDPVSSPMRHRNQKICLSGVAGHEYERLVVLEERVRSLLALMSDAKLNAGSPA
jgi:copper homeostasis protein